MAAEMICPACKSNAPSSATNLNLLGRVVVYCTKCGVVYVPLPKKE